MVLRQAVPVKQVRRDFAGILKLLVRVLLTIAMVSVGILHFVNPEPFVRIVPAFLPAPLALVYISGVFEIALGIALHPNKTRKLAAWGLVALYVAVFPANINMAIHQIQLSPDSPMPVWMMWARLPFQALFIVVALWVGDILKRRST